jgi:hypothetical protein
MSTALRPHLTAKQRLLREAYMAASNDYRIAQNAYMDAKSAREAALLWRKREAADLAYEAATKAAKKGGALWS